MQPTNKPTRGGKRKGAGRKPVDTIPILLRLKPSTIKAIREAAVKPKTMGQVVDAKFKKGFKSPLPLS